MTVNKEEFQKDLQRFLRAQNAGNGEKTDTKGAYNALGKAVMAYLSADWEGNRNAKKKRCGYFSAEFLIGRTVFSNLLNLGLLENAKEALATIGKDLYDLEAVDDAALGNGGLGRLAACFLDSAASIGVPLDGYGLRYRYGLFKQKFEDGFQKEAGDDWLVWGDPFSVRREIDRVQVTFADLSVYAVPYDMPVIGYQNGVINTLRLWQSEPIKPFDFDLFDKMEGGATALSNFAATSITDVLYPNDNTEAGKILRLRQQYLMVSASLQDFLRKYEAEGSDWEVLPNRQVFQLNDTHPVLAIPEFIRLLKERGVSFQRALCLAGKTFRFTNHTIMAEALEKWKTDVLRKILPDVLDVIEEIQAHLDAEGLDKETYYVIKDGEAHMANLAVYVCEKVNGVAKIHTGILKKKTFSDWYALCPKKFVNVTNGITPRRWMMLNNPKFAKLITEYIGVEWAHDLKELEKLKTHIQDKELLRRFSEIKRENKENLSAYILTHEGIELPAHFVFDTQIKRLHEYKRQLLNAFAILHIYYQIKAGKLSDLPPTAFLFGAKAAPGYYNAKAIIKFINEIAKTVNADESVRDKLRVAFVQNYNVSYAEKMVCGSDISEQISMAGMEASGTGNMKFMLNGTVTLGTLDGANVEICEEAGAENNYIFGARVEDVERIKQTYEPQKILEENADLKRVTDTLIDGTFEDGGTGFFKAIYDSLTVGEHADKYLVLYDFADYVEKKLAAIKDCGSDSFLKKCLYNTAGAGKFSSDRSIAEYAEKIWKL
ncbi:MAG: glycogen/starch/alpha-glucan family phosphorylase [Clostridia bacterium]|nr:glycogen/starch/alpha-glucan family phosphorylase [Clostridia bacterium]